MEKKSLFYLGYTLRINMKGHQHFISWKPINTQGVGRPKEILCRTLAERIKKTNMYDQNALRKSDLLSVHARKMNPEGYQH